MTATEAINIVGQGLNLATQKGVFDLNTAMALGQAIIVLNGAIASQPDPKAEKPTTEG